VSHKDAPPATAVQIAVETFYTNLLKPQGVTVGWGRDKHGKFLASYARDAQAAWEAAQALPCSARRFSSQIAEAKTDGFLYSDRST
jgi:hypothetical protein